jgi:hypothetical protein
MAKTKILTERGTPKTAVLREAQDAVQEHRRSASVKPATQEQEFESGASLNMDRMSFA